MQVLQKCEIKATHDIEEMQSNLEQLKEKLATSSVNHEKGKIFQCEFLYSCVHSI